LKKHKGKAREKLQNSLAQENISTNRKQIKQSENKTRSKTKSTVNTVARKSKKQ